MCKEERNLTNIVTEPSLVSDYLNWIFLSYKRRERNEKEDTK